MRPTKVSVLSLGLCLVLMVFSSIRAESVAKDYKQGEFLIDTTITYGPAVDEQLGPSIAFDGTNYFVVWGDYELAAIFGTRVSQTGGVLDLPPIKIADAWTDWEDNRPHVAFGEDNYLVVWVDEDYGKICGARITPEGTLLDTTPITICSTSYEVFEPAVTFGTNNFLVVWSEDREDCNIYGARVTPTGIVLDSTPIPIATAPLDQDEPTVAFDGTNYFVVWTDEGDIYGARVSPEGLVLDTVAIPISTAPNRQGRPTATFGTANYFIAWEDSRNGFPYSDIYGARVSPTGSVLDSNGIAVSLYPEYKRDPALAFDGTNYFVVWEDTRGPGYHIYGTRVTTDGIVLDTNGIPICTTQVSNDQWLPALAFGDSNYFVAWTDERFDEDIYGSRVTPEGLALDPAGMLISFGANEQTSPQAAFDGTNYLVVWQDYRNGDMDIYGARLNSSGIILDPTPIPIATAPNDQRYPQVIFGGNYFFVIWEDYRNGNCDIYGTRISTDGVVLDTNGLPISVENYNQYSPKVVFGIDQYFVVWIDQRSHNYSDLYGARVDTSGSILDPYGIRISTTIGSSRFQVIFGGGNFGYFVVWEDTRTPYYYRIYGARISRSGYLLDPNGISIANVPSNQHDPQIVLGNGTYLVVWVDNRTGNDDIYGTRVTRLGGILDPEGIPIAASTNIQSSPKLVFGSNQYFVIWFDYQTYQIYGARLATNGVVIDTAGIRIASAELGLNLQLIFDSTYYAIVWDDYRNGWDNSDIYGARVDIFGQVLDTFSVVTQPGQQRYPVLVRGPENQVLVAYQGWTDTMVSRTYNAYRIWGRFLPAVGIEEKNLEPRLSILLSNSPNPFRKMTTIRYSISKLSNVSIKIYDIKGNVVRNLFNGTQKPGAYGLNWNGIDNSGKKLPAGIYILCLKTTEGVSKTEKLIILK